MNKMRGRIYNPPFFNNQLTMKKTLLFLVAGFFFLNNLPAQKPIEQKEIRLVQYMPNIPFPYKMKNWKDIATKQDRLFRK